MEDVKAGLRGRPGWSAAQYTTVLQRLVQTPYGAIDADTLFTQLPPDKRAAVMAVQAMVQANLLSYRPPSGAYNLHGFAELLSNPACPRKPEAMAFYRLSTGHTKGGLWPRPGGCSDSALSRVPVLHAPPSEAGCPQLNCSGECQ